MKRWRGAKKLVHEAVDHTTDLVEEAHESVARKTSRWLGLLGPAVGPARLVEQVQRATTGAVFATIHGVNRAVEALTDEGLDLLEQVEADGSASAERPQPMRSDASGSLPWLGDAALGAVNGVLGDYLHARSNGLDLGMAFRHGDRFLELGGERLAAEQLPGATGKVVLFVHGLCCTEWSWTIGAEEHHGDPAVTFGALLARDLGLTPLYARYNSGRHVSENGRLLAERLEALRAAWPCELEELVLVGHSMGGLVVRSACALAEEQGLAWRGSLRRVVCLGSPHRGTTFEKLGNVASSVLRLFDTPGTRIPARVIDTRSAGIKDLRFGSLRDEDWQGRDPDAFLEDACREVPLLEGVAYCFIGATVTRSAGHPLGRVLGDVLVAMPSATALAAKRQAFRIEAHHFGGMHHFDLQNHPEVYEQVRRFCAGEVDGPGRTDEDG